MELVISTFFHWYSLKQSNYIYNYLNLEWEINRLHMLIDVVILVLDLGNALPKEICLGGMPYSSHRKLFSSLLLFSPYICRYHHHSKTQPTGFLGNDHSFCCCWHGCSESCMFLKHNSCFWILIICSSSSPFLKLLWLL